MHKQNIADFILYDISKNHGKGVWGVNSGIISEVVEKWNRDVYVTPRTQVKFHHQSKLSHPIIN